MTCCTPPRDRRALVALLVFAAGAWGCARLEARVIPLGAPSRAVGAVAGEVRIVRPPVTELGAEEVGLVELTGYDARALDDAPEALRRAAREVGADTVVWLRTDRGTGFVRVTASLVRTRRRR